MSDKKLHPYFYIEIVKPDPMPAMRIIQKYNESLPEPKKGINVKVLMLVIFGVLFLLHPIAVHDMALAFEKMFYILAVFLATFTPMAIYSMFYR